MPMPIIESQTTDERLARLKTIAEQHTQALNRLEDYMRKFFRWLIDLMVIAWVSTMVTISLKVD